MRIKGFKTNDESSVIDQQFTTAMFAYIAANLVTALGPTIDSIFVGSCYQVEEVAAIGLTAFLLVGYRTIAASIITRGAHVLASRYIGAGDKEGANQYFSLSIVMGLVASVGIALFTILFSSNIAQLLGARGALENLMKPTSDYLIGYCLGLPFFTLASILTPFLQMDGDYDLVTLHSIVLTGVDIAEVRHSLTLDSNTLINVYFKPADGYSGSFTAAVDNGTAAEYSKGKDGRYCVQISGIPAHDLSKDHTITVNAANSTVTVTVSALSYINSALNYYNDTNDADCAARNAVAAIYAYSKAADAYKTAHPDE